MVFVGSPWLFDGFRWVFSRFQSLCFCRGVSVKIDLFVSDSHSHAPSGDQTLLPGVVLAAIAVAVILAVAVAGPMLAHRLALGLRSRTSERHATTSDVASAVFVVTSVPGRRQTHKRARVNDVVSRYSADGQVCDTPRPLIRFRWVLTPTSGGQP